MLHASLGLHRRDYPRKPCQRHATTANGLVNRSAISSVSNPMPAAKPEQYKPHPRPPTKSAPKPQQQQKHTRVPAAISHPNPNNQSHTCVHPKSHTCFHPESHTCVYPESHTCVYPESHTCAHSESHESLYDARLYDDDTKGLCKGISFRRRQVQIVS